MTDKEKDNNNDKKLSLGEESGKQDWYRAGALIGAGINISAGSISPASNAGATAGGVNLNGGPVNGISGVPTAALLGTGTLEGTNKYSAPILGGPGPYGLVPGFTKPWAGTYATYRIASAHPTHVIAGASLVGQVLGSQWSYETKKNAPSGARAFIQDTMERSRTRLLIECLKAVTTFGYRAFEKVFEVRDGMVRLVKLKPLLPELTDILVDDKGNFAGVRNTGVELGPDKVFLYTYDQDGDYFYGRPRLENTRRVWSNWLKTEDQLGRLGSKTSSIIPIMRYPPGQGFDSLGQPRTNYSIAVAMAAGLASGRPIVVPNLAGLQLDDFRNLSEFADKSLWGIDTVDMGNPGPAIEALLKQLQYYDTLMVRGMLRPERSLLEQSRGGGSRADSETHSDIGISDSDMVHADIVAALNDQVVNALLVYNYGDEARATVRIKAAPLADDKQLLDQEVLGGLIKSPQGLAQLIAHTDMQAWLDRVGLPKNEAAGEWDGSILGETKSPPGHDHELNLARDKYTDQDGHWVTIRGNPVFISDQPDMTHREGRIGSSDASRGINRLNPGQIPDRKIISPGGIKAHLYAGADWQTDLESAAKKESHPFRTDAEVDSMKGLRQQVLDHITAMQNDPNVPPNDRRIVEEQQRLQDIDRWLREARRGGLQNDDQTKAADDRDEANRTRLHALLEAQRKELEDQLTSEGPFGFNRRELLEKMKDIDAKISLISHPDKVRVDEQGNIVSKNAQGSTLIAGLVERRNRNEQIKNMSGMERLKLVLNRLQNSDKLSEQAKSRLRELADPSNAKLLLAAVAATAIATATGVAEELGAVLVTMFGAQVLSHVGKVEDGLIIAIAAHSDDDINEAADNIAEGLTQVGSDVAQVVVGKAVGKVIGKGAKKLFGKEPVQEGGETSASTTKDAQELYEQAIRSEPAVTTDMKEVAESTGGKPEGLENRIKTPDSLQRKLKTVSADELNDALRYTITYDKGSFAAGAQSALDSLRQRGYVVNSMSNTFVPGAPYRGLNVRLIAPNGTPIELQFHTPESYAMKQITHPEYEQWRSLPDKNSPEAKALRQRMIEQSDNVSEPPGAHTIH